MVAAREDQIGLVLLRLHMLQTRGEAFRSLAFGGNVNVGQMRDPQDALTRGVCTLCQDGSGTGKPKGCRSGDTDHFATRNVV